MQSALLGEVADKRGGPLQGGEEGLKVVSHLHSPIKFLYFETQGMRQNRVRRVSLVTGGTNKQHWNKDRGEWGGRVSSSQHTDINVVIVSSV